MKYLSTFLGLWFNTPSRLASLVSLVSLTSLAATTETKPVYRHAQEALSLGTSPAHTQVWEVHYPGLVTWYKNSMLHTSYDIPGCFFISLEGLAPKDAAPELAHTLAQGLTLKAALEAGQDSAKRALTLVSHAGIWAFLDPSVESVYMSYYTVSTTTGHSFSELYDETFKHLETKPRALLRFSQGCSALQQPLLF